MFFLALKFYSLPTSDACIEWNRISSSEQKWKAIECLLVLLFFFSFHSLFFSYYCFPFFHFFFFFLVFQTENCFPRFLLFWNREKIKNTNLSWIYC
jgi:hypothetical protein